MVRFPTLVAASFAVIITTAAYAHAAPAVTEIAGDVGQTLTLGGAKQMVAAKLAADGQRTVRPGRAEFDGEGNVKVEIVTLQGLPISHVIVHAVSGMITDANVKKGARG